MAGMSVVQYNSNVLQQSTKTNNNERRDVIIIRKPPQILPQPAHEILITNTARKKAKAAKEAGRVQNPPPIAVARRNARERNRVKQVNNGFATLRQHIPNSIAAAFESNSGRGGNKKLSKVETLRMAVEYIRSLEDMLASEDHDFCESISTSSNFSSYPSPAPSSPALTTSTSYKYPIKSPPADEDDVSTNPTPPPPQYIRISGTNAYQIIQSHLYEDGENLQPLHDQILTDPTLMDADLEFDDVKDLSLLNSIHTSTSLSPDIYSEHSLSPSSVEKGQYLPVFTRELTPPLEDIKFNIADVKEEHPVISLHTNMQISQEHKENMLHVMAWWEQQQNSSS